LQDAWHILRWAWAAVFIAYCVLEIFAEKRLQGREKKRSSTILIVMVILVAVRIGIRVVFGSGPAYRLAVTFVEIAAGIGALVLAKMLIEQKKTEGSYTQGADEQIQTLKLR
jgi:heme A synthase